MARRPLAAVYLMAAMALTGTNVAFGKAIATAFPVYFFVAFRFAVASLALAPMAHAEPGPRLQAMSWRQWRELVLMAALGMVGFTVLMLEGLKHTAAADAGIITATLPAVVALLGVVLIGDRLSLTQGLAVTLAVSGLVLVQVTSAADYRSTLVGNLMVAGAVLCEASFVLLGKRLAPPYRPLRLALGTNIAGLAMVLPLALLDMSAFDVRSVPPGAWLLGTWYALSASVLCLWLWYAGLPHVETWLAGLATAAIPVAALATSALYLGETIGPMRLAGAAIVIAAIALGALSPRAQLSLNRQDDDKGPQQVRAAATGEGEPRGPHRGTMSDRSVLQEFEQLAEAAYATMYDARPHNVKDSYDDAMSYLARAIETAARGGLDEDVARLRRRVEQITSIYNNQFRGVSR
jgi:drug/metabolite transporter (DMT)-like permease